MNDSNIQQNNTNPEATGNVVPANMVNTTSNVPQNNANPGVSSNVVPANMVNTTPNVQPPLPASSPTPVSVTQNTTATEVSADNGSDSQTLVNEDLKKVEINYTPPSKFKIFMMIFFFVGILSFVIFLPDITSYVHKLQSGELNQVEEKITTGRMTCSLENHTTNLDKKYSVVFTFAASKLEKMQLTITTRGDVTQDEAVLDNLNQTCEQLSKNVKKINGVSVTCDYVDGKLVESQHFELSGINAEQLDSAFTEAGGTQPNYTYGQNIDSIEKNMKASNYECIRTKS